MTPDRKLLESRRADLVRQFVMKYDHLSKCTDWFWEQQLTELLNTYESILKQEACIS